MLMIKHMKVALMCLPMLLIASTFLILRLKTVHLMQALRPARTANKTV